VKLPFSYDTQKLNGNLCKLLPFDARRVAEWW